MLAGWEGHADDMRVELVPGCGHYIAAEPPELVLERATEFFAGDVSQDIPLRPGDTIVIPQGWF